MEKQTVFFDNTANTQETSNDRLHLYTTGKLRDNFISGPEVTKGLKLYLPNESGYDEFLADQQSEFKRGSYFFGNNKTFVLDILGVDLTDEKYFDTDGNLLDSKKGEVERKRLEDEVKVMSQYFPLISFESFQKQSLIRIYTLIHRPVLKLFFFLKLCGKTPYSSSGSYEEGETINYLGDKCSLGVSFKETIDGKERTFRGALVNDNIVFFERISIKVGWLPISDALLTTLNINPKQALPVTLEDFKPFYRTKTPPTLLMENYFTRVAHFFETHASEEAMISITH